MQVPTTVHDLHGQKKNVNISTLGLMTCVYTLVRYKIEAWNKTRKSYNFSALVVTIPV